MSDTNKELSFEEALAALENIVENLEKDDVPIEKTIDFYQEGMKLSKVCDDILNNAQEKMTKILNEDDQQQPFHIQEDGR